ncbi:MAG: transposase [Gammaproteobacteria bacterium]|nr:transposase [Gammaproteobacteria bacterium]
MPRAHRYFLPGHAWHITHRCHGQEFLLKFAKDRRRWWYWLFEAKKRYGLCVLNYIITSNHIHLLVLDKTEGALAKSMQLVAGRTAQEYNQRKLRQGAFWEDRYHATAVETDAHLARCLVYIDLNMVRAGVVRHPAHWCDSGYRDIQNPPSRYAIIDLPALVQVLGFTSLKQLQAAHRSWIEAALEASHQQRQGMWTDSLAIGSPDYVARVQAALGVTAKYRSNAKLESDNVLKEAQGSYAILGAKRAV